MKLFIADTCDYNYISDTDYHWCNNGEILMFGLFQLDKPNNISMCGIQSRKFTTNITVADIDISIDFLREMLIESVEISMQCVVDSNGNFKVDLFDTFEFNINIIIDELLENASKFDIGEKLICCGRKLNSVNNLKTI